MPIIESVPNFSEGRRQDVIDAIVDRVRSSGPVRVLDLSSDADHNRSVLTLAGEPDAVLEGLEALVAICLERIDLTRHEGGHPRMGAVDVMPLIPIRNITMEECVSLARRLGESIAAKHALPVYLYEAAASADHRRNLAAIRKGGFEGFPDKIGDPLWTPDFGPGRVHATGGCVAVGAREFLIAYNINLSTPDVEIAGAIARAVRHSSGGLRYVKAMGVRLEERDIAQVSMNLTNFRKTPIHRVFEMVRSEASRHGVTIVGSEIVGLVPDEALLEASAHYLRIEGFDPDRILERRLEAADRPAEPGGEDGSPDRR
ncbi:MAG: glutamate formimidoyltransferase [Acidobacteriota bacterium]